MHSWIRFSLLGFFFLSIDLVSKAVASKMLIAPLVLIPNIFSLSLTFNTGIAFSVPIPNGAQIVFSLAVFAWFFWYIGKKGFQNQWEFLGSVLIASGALGNFLERLFVRSVTDFIAVWKFPIFNLADSFLFVGALCWGISIFWIHSKKSSS